MLDIATATPPFATQDPALDAASQYLRPSYGTIFYLALEASAPRLQEMRMRLAVARPGLPLLTNLNITNTWKPFTASEGLHDLCDWLRSYPDTRLLVIDNLASLRPLFKGNDRELLSILRRLAEQLQISILLLHTCKRSSPLVSQVDHHLYLKRLPVSTFYLLDSLGSLLQPTSYLLHCPSDLLSFRIAKLDESLALTTLSAHKTLTSERLALLRLFHDYGSFLTSAQVSAALQLDYDCTRQLLSKMAKASLLIAASRGRYTLHPAIRLLVPSLLTQYPFLPKTTIAHIPPPTPKFQTPTPTPNPPTSTPLTLTPKPLPPPQPPPIPLHLMPPPNLPALLHPKPQSLTFHQPQPPPLSQTTHYPPATFIPVSQTAHNSPTTPISQTAHNSPTTSTPTISHNQPQQHTYSSNPLGGHSSMNPTYNPAYQQQRPPTI